RVTYSKNAQNVLEIIEENNYYPFGLKHKGYNEYVATGNKYKYQGQERQDELLLAWDSFKYRNYDYAIGRFINIDPLTEKYMDWSPYVFSGNRVVDCRELEGLEPIVARKGTQNLILVNQGFAGEAPKGASQAQNAGKTDSELGIDYSGLGKFTSLDNEKTGTQVGVFASSQGDGTKKDIATTIKNFRSQNKNGRVIAVGHSLGADNLIEMANENPSLKIDYMLTIDTADDYDDDNIPSNVKNIVNYYVKNGGVFGAAIGGEDVEINDPAKTNGINVPVISTHRQIDNDYIQNFLNRVITYLNQQSNEKKE
ncbi:RHS repeat domain-containing protein, partial [Flavobacterium circumlabens]